VLRDDGTVWLNLGDSYASGGATTNLGRNDAGRNNGGSGGNRLGTGNPGRQGCVIADSGLKPKDLIGIPWRVALALQADGWWLRSDIIWHKPNPMPESVTDRPTKAHEYIFLLSKSARYYYDAEALKEPVAQSSVDRLSQATLPEQAGSDRVPGKTNGNMKAVSRNKRSVWTVSTVGYKEAHFATFPPKLIEPCILAGTSANGCCPECGAPWERGTEKQAMKVRTSNRGQQKHDAGLRTSTSGTLLEAPVSTTIGWRPTCECGEWSDILHSPLQPVSCTVLDPFAGTSTVGQVAIELGRDYIGIELNPDYVALSEQRMAGAQPALFGI